MSGLSTDPWIVRFWRRYFETAKQRRRRHARSHKEFFQRIMLLRENSPPMLRKNHSQA